MKEPKKHQPARSLLALQRAQIGNQSASRATRPSATMATPGAKPPPTSASRSSTEPWADDQSRCEKSNDSTPQHPLKQQGVIRNTGRSRDPLATPRRSEVQREWAFGTEISQERDRSRKAATPPFLDGLLCLGIKRVVSGDYVQGGCVWGLRSLRIKKTVCVWGLSARYTFDSVCMY